MLIGLLKNIFKKIGFQKKNDFLNPIFEVLSNFFPNDVSKNNFKDVQGWSQFSRFCRYKSNLVNVCICFGSE